MRFSWVFLFFFSPLVASVETTQWFQLAVGAAGGFRMSWIMCLALWGGEFRRHTQVELSAGMFTRGGLRGVRLLCAASFPETGDFQRKEVEGAGLTDVGPMSLLRSAKKSWL